MYFIQIRWKVKYSVFSCTQSTKSNLRLDSYQSQTAKLIKDIFFLPWINTLVKAGILTAKY